MPISAGDFRKGVVFEMDGKPMLVVDFQHVKPGKGAAFVRTKYKNVMTGAIREESFNPSAKFENGTVEIVKMADWDTVKSYVFAKAAIRFVQSLPEARLLKSVVVPFEMGISEKPALPTSTAKATKINPAYTISLRQTECRKTGETITAAVYEYLVDNDGEWGELRFDFENGTAEIVKLADWDTVKSNVFAKTAIRYIQGLQEARLLKSVAVLFWKGRA